MTKPIRLAVLGAGGLGRKAISMLEKKKEATLVAICDKGGLAYNAEGITTSVLPDLERGGCAAVGQSSEDSIADLMAYKDEIDGIVLTLPNLPNEFMPGIVEQIVDADYKGCFVDALKRTRAMQITFELDEKLQAAQCTYITGAGATPGLLSAAAVLAAQSFATVESVDINWGVGISNWDTYRATIREDIAHLPGYDVDSAKAMTDEQITELLDKTDGKLELCEMEHADDLLLQKVGVVDNLDQVTVGGVMDTRSAEKPVQTTMTLTGTTFESKRSEHKFVLGNQTSMAANVLGPALGYIKRALWLRERGIHGVFGSTEFMPMVLR
jgi:8-amino-7-oxononanoate carboxylating dehydrogenase